jgi:hypothetical protein
MGKERPLGITLLAIFGLIGSPLALVIGLALLFVLVLATPDPLEFLVIPMFLLTWGAIGLTAATGLLLFARWGWALSLAVAALTLPWAPYGTVAGILVLWYLLKPEVRAIFAPSAYFPPSVGSQEKVA